MRAVHPHLQWLDDLPPLFAEPVDVRRNLRHMLQTMQSWRGEAQLVKDIGRNVFAAAFNALKQRFGS